MDGNYLVNSTRKVRIGILGCANIAKRSVIPSLLELNKYFQVVAVASRSPEKASEFGDLFKCESVVGYEPLLLRDDIEALYIPLPTGLHLEWISKAILRGKHVYAEKSFASDLNETKQLTSMAKAQSVALMEGYMFIYHAQHRYVLNLLKNGQLGDLRHFSGYFGFPPLPSENFRYDQKVGGGALMDAAGYPVRAAHLICGDSLTVCAASTYFDPQSGTTLWGSAFLSDGRGLGASIAYGFDNSYQCNYSIWGSKAKLTVERAYTPQPQLVPQLVLENADGKHIIDTSADNHFSAALIEFYRAIINPSHRDLHYNQILNQSMALQCIRDLSTRQAHSL